ncbi:hypothetical protein [Undibacterium sp. Ji22W]|uniref:hypothetical protein n=1 Tax=Undibacterium sp. Ji22W TaxID=3413038 RepID=UPI003BF37C1C
MNLRSVMPATAVKIDFMRARMGVVIANELIKRAMAGEVGCFFSMENLHTFGTPDTRVTSCYSYDLNGMQVRSDPPWMVDAIEFALTRGIEIKRDDMQDYEEAREVAARLRLILTEAKYG